MKQAIILFGPPGSGKSTQASLVAHQINGIHIDTGRYIEEVLRSSAQKSNAKMKRRQEQFDTGELIEPAWVVRILSKKIERISHAGFSVIFSGSPRREYEAEHLLPTLAHLYGKKNIKVFLLDIPEKISIKRNSIRLICPFCDMPSLAGGKTCTRCGHSLKKRTLDKPEIIKRRLVEYQRRTMPVLGIIRRHGYRIITINGEPAPYQITQRILKHLMK